VADDQGKPGGGNLPPNMEQQKGASSARFWIFCYDLFWIALLITLAVGYVHYYPAFRDALNASHPNIRLTIECIWFGALGGIIISLKGIYDHPPADWDDGFRLWHVGRPISGAIAGLMTIVLLMALNPSGQLSEAIVYSVAFILGTQERRFFDLLSEIARLLVQVPSDVKTDSAGLRITDVQPPEGKQGVVLTIKGQGMNPKVTIRLGSSPIENLVVAADGASATGTVPAPPAGTNTVDVLVINSDGGSFLLPNKFKFVA
jgi:hypothetical protein